MATTQAHAAPKRVHPAPTWARRAAHLAALTPLPSALWRLALAVGLPAGYTSEGLEAMDLGPAGIAWILLLVVGTEGAALLTLGLVQPWGEVVPRWVPRLGGSPIPAHWVTRVSWAGVAILTVLWTPLLFWWSFPHDELTTVGSHVVGVLYLPLVAWAPLLAAVTIDFQRRHRGH